MKSKIVCIDFETANSASTSPCALGIAILENGVITDTHSWMIKPHPKMSYFAPENIAIHNITPDMVADAQEMDQVFGEFFPYTENAILAAHNARFDMAVLKRTLHLYHVAIPDFRYICTLEISRKLWELESHRLNVVCDFIGHELNHHEAQSDAIGAAAILQRGFDEYPTDTIEEFLAKFNISIKALEAMPLYPKRSKSRL